MRPEGAVDVSVIVPLRDEEANVHPLLDELIPVLDRAGWTFEVILVDDGSRDTTFAHLVTWHRSTPRLHVLRFSRNFGQSAAFTAAFGVARGHLIVTFDGDLQNDPSDIPRLVAMADNADIVCGWRRRRRDAFLTRHVPSVVANWLIGVVTGVVLHDNGCSLKVFRAETVTPLTLEPGMHRYLPAIASQLGNRVVEVEVRHRPRRFGRSKYGLSRTFRVITDLVRLRSLMRRAINRPASAPALYEISESLPPGPAGSRKPEARSR
jgi:glycosyltransferase involved in cell wall biosynthesis